MAVITNKSPFNIANAILALSIGILVIVVAVPVLLIFINSFWVDGQFNITDVVQILKQQETYEALLNSLFIASGVTIMSTCVGTFFAWLVTRTDLPYKGFMKVMFFSKNFQFGEDAINKLEGLFKEMDKNKLTHGDVSEMTSYDISFDKVTFCYEEGINVLENLSIEFPAGRRYALVGSSGGGKSTIAKLISGFYPVSSGGIKIGGKDISEYRSDVLEKNIAFVFQNAKLFKTSIYENVLIGNPESSHEEVMKALELAMCGSILDKFESRENTVIGAKGVHLSGGETQRIAIARAILKNAPIIIFDEASAASDPENEYEMQQAFTELMRGKTVIMIAHRLSSIRDVDEILVIENGKVAERGSHYELISKESKYRNLQQLYSKANEWRLS